MTDQPTSNEPPGDPADRPAPSAGDAPTNLADGSDASEQEIAPLHAPMLRIIEVGLLGWLVALVVTLVVPSLHQGDRDWWPWTCVAGLVLGGMGWAYVRRGRGNAEDAA